MPRVFIGITVENWRELLDAGLAAKLPPSVAQALSTLARTLPPDALDAEAAVLGLVANELEAALAEKGVVATVQVMRGDLPPGAHAVGPWPAAGGGALFGFVLGRIL